MTPPPITMNVSYRERPSTLGLCIKQSDDIIVKPSQAVLDVAEYEKKRASIIKEEVYDKAAPIPGITPSPGRNKFLREVMEGVSETAQTCDIELR